jgi:endonuclease YncB( thermonuclease family)
VHSPFNLSRSDFEPRYGWKNSLLREMVQALVKLPSTVKLLIAVFLVAEFVVITQWEKLPFVRTARPVAAKQVIPVPQPRQPSPASLKSAATDKLLAAAAQQHIIKRMEPIVLADPQVQADGSIHNKGQRLYLYGIKPFNSKQVCTRTTGERWACGLEAFATLHNEVAKKTIVCEPKEMRPDGIAATCRMGGTNIALVLVQKGLAALDGNATAIELLNAQDAAKREKLGIWNH